ncbi:leukotriene A-4 hydrolase-like [Temnothorax americanus]|uniref:leukotriene A-4 hydrolase-like n=1 Tax=Temnothorax americanus TaxID=1964332 RepID=UPI00406768C8
MDPLPQPPAGDIPYSYSRPDLVTVTHTHLELSVNFKRHVLKGKAILFIKKKASTCNELVLDTYKLKISDVKKGIYGLTFTHVENPHDDNFGSKLIIELPDVGSADPGPSTSKKPKSDDIYKIQVIYETSPESPALYWLEPHQTSDGIHPLLISNSKFTYARAIFPCQDTPSYRMTFFSKIIVPKNLNLNVIMMPGRRDIYKKDDEVEYTFISRPTTIATHEIYIIVGSLNNLHEMSSDDVSLDIWAEKEPCERCRAFLNKIMDILYNIKKSYGFFGKSVNVCVLPPNVPEFDMQYPSMTFVSSSLLEGQYSIIDTIVQNVIESWIGGIIAINNFKHLWLIKGLSTFIYRNPKNNKIIDDENKFRRDLEMKSINNVLNMPELLNNIPLVPVFTKNLLPKNIIKYVSEKGCVFLNFLQDMLGGPEEFKDFLVSVWPFFEKREIREATDYFKNRLISYFSRKGKDIGVLNAIEWDKWLNKPGFPSYPYTYEKNKTHWQRQADLWIAQDDTLSFDRIGLEQSNDLAIIEFLTYLLTLSTVLTAGQLQEIEREFLRDQNICEIRFLWLRLCIKSEWLNHGQIQEDALNFACSEYCMPKYACPIFRDLYNLAQTRIMAIKSRFKERDNRSKMLPETIKELESILQVKLDGRT